MKNKEIKSNLDEFSTGLREHIETHLQKGVPPEFMVMRLELNKVELANMHIGLTIRRQQEEQAESMTSNIVNVNGQLIPKEN